MTMRVEIEDEHGKHVHICSQVNVNVNTDTNTLTIFEDQFRTCLIKMSIVEDEWLYPKALQISQEAGKISTNILCKSLQIGPYRAGRLLERMEQEGRLGRADRLGRREVIVKDPPNPGQLQQQGEPGSESDPLFVEAVALVSQQGGTKDVTVLKSHLGSVSEWRFQKIVDRLKSQGIIPGDAEMQLKKE